MYVYHDTPYIRYDQLRLLKTCTDYCGRAAEPSRKRTSVLWAVHGSRAAAPRRNGPDVLQVVCTAPIHAYCTTARILRDPKVRVVETRRSIGQAGSQVAIGRPPWRARQASVKSSARARSGYVLSSHESRHAFAHCMAHYCRLSASFMVVVLFRVHLLLFVPWTHSIPWSAVQRSGPGLACLRPKSSTPS